jgi:ATP-dependent exoDNAse (exonuclease V) beta subunit
VNKAEIIDYKTDAVNDPGELIERYRPQMAAYRTTLCHIFPEIPVETSLLSVHHAAMVPIDRA